MNDILNLTLDNAKIIAYADDTAIIFHDTNWNLVYKRAEEGLLKIAKALDNNILTLNIKKTKLYFTPISIYNADPTTRI
ncbi:hypothetical protein B5X24_HaOG212874 [Helicoverpa armigera]|uniref:Reverse transcriptase domain-containing protein n=1 Tax=Helicoverpa armigera TaxID=29058 RepID=A0A2W1BIY6_HELAM|nr:hypothetical protein B5X24_HaOG212874 [Helicoverpa armigera]